ncbi:hypothetical protein Ga0074812_13958 [Parafrankia irregularis]|uniref:DUF308 domain-containing protein n=1 Tax=Parafrankia irregularis TaxID=795642 RepID=A0A0S4QXZ9_9ACTN|nr:MULTISPECIES: hypothetical protein [Parafrankia]MBE3206378.1 hypothetical protein [Parafrankia sp. CH37]CUU60423.1 hypothetical protein Ga0074812_13958 [Parafrankia irregularis]
MTDHVSGAGPQDADPDRVPTEPGSPTAPTGATPAGDDPTSPGDTPSSAAPSAAAAADTGDADTRSTDTGAGAGAGAGRSPATDEAAFLDLVARFHEEPAGSEQSWPAAEDLDEPRRSPIIIIRPSGRRPDGMPPDGRHLAEDDPGERTIPPSPAAPSSSPSPFTGGDVDRAPTGEADRDRDGGQDQDRDRDGDTPPSGSRPGDIDRLDEAVRAALRPAGGADPFSAGEDPDEDHYIPPPAPPIPRMRPGTRWALGSIALGVAILVVPSLIGMVQARSRDVAGVLLILGGVGTLVARLGDRPPTDFDGPDDGAVV